MNLKNKRQIILEKMLEDVELPSTAYEKAVKRYESLGEWFSREESSLKEFDPHIFPQGSFRLGTAVRPLHDKDAYDLDLTCKLRAGLLKTTHSQKDLKETIGQELELYRKAKNIQKELTPKHRCWRLEYLDDLSFHMDIVPCIPESENKRKSIYDSLSKSGVDSVISNSVANQTVSITDDRHPHFTSVHDEWLISNPEGYATWFESRMRTTQRFDLMEKAQVDDVPTYKKKTALQQAIQLLKRHRDSLFKDAEELQPISIIITTLAARAYSGEQDLDSCITNILSKMGQFVGALYPRVPNPVDPGEDFADRWSMPKYAHLQLEKNFWRWLEQAKNDFNLIASSEEASFIAKQAVQKFTIRMDENDLMKSLGLNSAPIKTSPKQHIVVNEPKPWREE